MWSLDYQKFNQFEQLRTGSLLICRPCQDIQNDHLENSWHQFLFADDFFENRGVPSDEQTNIDFGTPNSIDNWKGFNKRDLHQIHLNINNVLSKFDELRVIATKSGATVTGITESKLDETVLDGEINIDGYELIRSDRNRHGGGIACYIRNDVTFNIRGNFPAKLKTFFFLHASPKN